MESMNTGWVLSIGIFSSLPQNTLTRSHTMYHVLTECFFLYDPLRSLQFYASGLSDIQSENTLDLLGQEPFCLRSFFSL